MFTLFLYCFFDNKYRWVVSRISYFKSAIEFVVGSGEVNWKERNTPGGSYGVGWGEMFEFEQMSWTEVGCIKSVKWTTIIINIIYPLL